MTFDLPPEFSYFAGSPRPPVLGPRVQPPTPAKRICLCAYGTCRKPIVVDGETHGTHFGYCLHQACYVASGFREPEVQHG